MGCWRDTPKTRIIRRNSFHMRENGANMQIKTIIDGIPNTIRKETPVKSGYEYGSLSCSMPA